MRPRLASLIAAVALALGSLGLVAPPAGAVTTVVPDPGFAACLNYYLGQPETAPITASQLQTVTGQDYGWGRLVVSCTKAITSIEGAQYLTHVAGLDLEPVGI